MTLWHFASCTAIFFEHLQRIVRVGGGGGGLFPTDSKSNNRFEDDGK